MSNSFAASRSREMKIRQGKASRAVAMWVVMMILLVHVHLSIAAQEVNNGTNYLGLIEDDFDSEFPDAISSHIHRRVLQDGGTKTKGASDANKPAFTMPANRYTPAYKGPSPRNPNSAPGCPDPYYRPC